MKKLGSAKPSSSFKDAAKQFASKAKQASTLPITRDRSASGVRPTAPKSSVATHRKDSGPFDHWAKIEEQEEQIFLEKSVTTAQIETLLRKYDFYSSREEACLQWTRQMESMAVPSNYSGPRFRNPLCPEDGVELIRHLRTNPNIPIHPKYVMRVVLASIEMMSKEDRVNEISVKDDQHTKLIVVGDTHGQLADVLWILQENGLPNPAGAKYLFNGDFVDRGEYGMEIMMILLVFKLLYPTSVYLNRGNHETEQVSSYYGFSEELRRKCGSPMMFDLFIVLFRHLPLASVIQNYALVLHGGLFRFDGVRVDHIRTIPISTDTPPKPQTYEEKLLFDLLWNDPQPIPGRQGALRGGDSIKFGPDVTEKFLNENGLKMIIRSHEVPSTKRGYEVLHGGKLITVFSASNYCGCQANQGGVMVFNRDMKYSFHEHWAPPLADFAKQSTSAPNNELVRSASLKKAEMNVVEHIRTMVCLQQQDLYSYFAALDRKGTGKVPVDNFLQGIQTIAKLVIPLQPYLPNLVTVENGQVDYLSFLEQFQVAVVDGKYSRLLQAVQQRVHDAILRADLSLREMVSLFNHKGDGLVDIDQVERAMLKLKLDVTRAQIKVLLRGLNAHDGRIDVFSFLSSLQCDVRCGSSVNLDGEGQKALTRLASLVWRHRKRLVESFEEFDVSGDGRLQYAEFVRSMKKLISDANEPPIADEVLNKVAQAVDSNQSGAIDYLEFVDAFTIDDEATSKPLELVVQHILMTLYQHKYSLRQAFDSMDRDRDGVLSLYEFREGLLALNALVPETWRVSTADINIVADVVDVNGDGCINWEEFLEAFKLVPPGCDSKTMSSPPSKLKRNNALARSKTMPPSVANSTSPYGNGDGMVVPPPALRSQVIRKTSYNYEQGSPTWSQIPHI